MKIAITGATGLVGQELAWALFEEGHDLVFLTRSPDSAKLKLGLPGRYLKWPGPLRDLDETEAVINLAGESIAEKRWSAEQKKKIRDSRVQLTHDLVAGLKVLKRPPHTLISASAYGFYGSRGNEKLVEDSKPGTDFLAKICVDWEKEAQAYSTHGRVALLRTGIVLSEKGGALSKMQMPFRLGTGGVLGSGEQWMSWIHLDDLVQIILFLLKNHEAKGPFNAVAPNPVTNREFTEALAKKLGMPAFLPVPAPALRLAVGEMADSVLASLRVYPQRLDDEGFHFYYPTLNEALEKLILPMGHDRMEFRQWIPKPVPDVTKIFTSTRGLEPLKNDSHRVRGVPVEWKFRNGLRPHRDGTIVTDEVIYRVGGGPLRGLVSPKVKRDVEALFARRRKRVWELL